MATEGKAGERPAHSGISTNSPFLVERSRDAPPSSFDLPLCAECEIRGTSSVAMREPRPSAWKAAVSALPKQ